MLAAKKKLTQGDKEAILGLARKGKGAVEISRALELHGAIVNGFMSTARKRGVLPSASPAGPRAPVTFPTQEDQLQTLAKSAEKSEPQAEFSIQTGSGRKIYIATYKEGLAIRIGDNKKAALLTPTMASRVGAKINEMATWCRLR
jgi:hypothetical protein